jgi:hypothetical protein
VCFLSLRTRLRVQRAPGIPHALFGRIDYEQLGRYPPRECEAVSRRLCEEYPDQRFALSEHRLRDEAIHSCFLVASWIASRSLSSGAHSRDRLARNDDLKTPCALAV